MLAIVPYMRRLDAASAVLRAHSMALLDVHQQVLAAIA